MAAPAAESMDCDGMSGNVPTTTSAQSMMGPPASNVLPHTDPRVLQQQLHMQQQLHHQQLHQQQLMQQQYQMMQAHGGSGQPPPEVAGGHMPSPQTPPHISPQPIGHISPQPLGHVSPQPMGQISPTNPSVGHISPQPNMMPPPQSIPPQSLAGPPQGVITHPTHMMNENPYARLCNFEIEKKIGRGQFSVVSKARCKLNGQIVALKKVQVRSFNHLLLLYFS